MVLKNICKFCGKEAKLIKAHIIPRKFYLDYKNEKYMLVNELTGKFQIRQSGTHDNSILCESCDSKILGVFEKEGYRVLFDEIYKHVAYKDDKTIVYHLTSDSYDYNKLRKFFISILWRASISSLPDFSHIQLGKYEGKAFEVLCNKNSHKHLLKIYIYKFPKHKDYNKFTYITKTKIANYKAFIINMAGYFIIMVIKGKNHPYTMSYPMKEMFLNDKGFYIIENEDLYNYHANIAQQKMQRIWKKGIKPPFANKKLKVYYATSNS
ncbi:hypothetical protein HDR58_05935 [bacterium]|nr:hypothetical protein [bacterium]